MATSVNAGGKSLPKQEFLDSLTAETYLVKNESEIPSPALLIFREPVERNIQRMLKIAGRPERLWPHVKTHKLAPLVRAQIDQGISKFKCATVAEAEMTAAAGASEVILAFQPVGPAIGRLMHLAQKHPDVTFATIVDGEETVAALGEAARTSSAVLDVLLDIDCGMKRTGVETGERAEGLYELICNTPGLRPGGLHAYDGHLHDPILAIREEQCETAFSKVTEFRGKLLARGLSVPRFICGGTPTFAIHAGHLDRGLSPGTCVLWDFGYGDAFPDLPFAPAALLLTRVVSKPGGNRVCLDLGYKAVASESPAPRVRFPEIPDAVALMHSEEHLVVGTALASQMKIGQCLHGIPRHICPTVALHSEAWEVRSGFAGECWPITARRRKITI